MAYGSTGLALVAIVLLSGALGPGIVVRAVGGTLAMLSILGMTLTVIATVNPALLRMFAVDDDEQA